jgi:hypothetical protein
METVKKYKLLHEIIFTIIVFTGLDGSSLNQQGRNRQRLVNSRRQGHEHEP